MLDEGSGTTCADSSGNNKTATITKHSNDVAAYYEWVEGGIRLPSTSSLDNPYLTGAKMVVDGGTIAIPASGFSYICQYKVNTLVGGNRQNTMFLLGVPGVDAAHTYNAVVLAAAPTPTTHYYNFPSKTTPDRYPAADAECSNDEYLTVGFTVDSTNVSIFTYADGVFTLAAELPLTVNSFLGTTFENIYFGLGDAHNTYSDMEYGYLAIFDNEFSFTETPPSTYTLTTDVVGSGTVTPDPDTETYEEDSSVVLTATAADGYEFTGWSGDISGTDNPYTLTMDDDKSVTATFTEIVNPDPTPEVQFFTGGPGAIESAETKSLTPKERRNLTMTRMFRDFLKQVTNERVRGI